MDNFDLGAALRHYRKRELLTMREMADKLNMSKSAYERLENGIIDPTYKMMMDIRKKLDLEEPIPTSLEGPTPPVLDSLTGQIFG